MKLILIGFCYVYIYETRRIRVRKPLTLTTVANVYSRAMIYFWIVVIAIGVLNHAIQQIGNSQIVRNHSSKSGGRPWNFYTSTVNRWIVPATFGDRCAQKVGWGTVPPRIQSLTLFAFLILNIALSIHGYRIVPINM